MPALSVSMIMLYWFQLSLHRIPCTSYVVVQQEIVLILYHIVPGFRYVRRTSSSDDSGITVPFSGECIGSDLPSALICLSRYLPYPLE